MFLTKLIILNNKSCKKIILDPSKTEPEILIGINDCGKSTILKSLEAFFDEKKNLNFIREDQQKSDLSNSSLNSSEINKILQENGYPNFLTYSGNVIAILCQLEIEENDVKNKEFQESSKNTHLKWSISDGKINLIRLFHNPELGAQNFSGYYLLVRDYRDGEVYLELWSKAAKDLIEVKKKFSVSDEDVKNENEAGRFKNIENIEAIYKKLPSLETRWSKYDNFSKDKNFFPSFKYLDWNFSLKDLEDMATEAMNKVTDPLLKDIKDLAQTKQLEAINSVNLEFERMMGDLKDDLPQCIKKINSSVFFSVNQRITDIKLTKDNIDGEVHIDNQGDGIKRQIWFALLKWRSRLLVGENKKNKYIWCFDEPETHLYPAAQRQLFDTLKKMCMTEYQILLSTHSTVFIDRTRISDVNQVVLENGYSAINKSDDAGDLFSCLGIKNSDFLFFNKFLAVEGYTEFELVPHLYKLFFKKTLLDDSIQIINLKGKSKCNSNKTILENILSSFQKSTDVIFYLFDNDTGILPGGKIFTSGTYDLEDSISNNIWIKFVKGNCGLDITDKIINDEIRAKLENKNDKKFYELLKNYITKNVQGGRYLPRKSDLGILLKEYIVDIEDIPIQVINLFNELNPPHDQLANKK